MFNVLNVNDAVDLDVLSELEDYMKMMSDKGMDWEILAYILMSGATRVCTEARALGDTLSLKNPLHGLMFWYIVKDFLCYNVTFFKFDIPGLSLTDGDADAQKPSSLATVEALADSKIAALQKACVDKVGKAPDYAQFFFQTVTVEESAQEQEGQDEQDGGARGAGSGEDEDDEPSDEEGEEDDHNDERRNPRKKQKGETVGPAARRTTAAM